MTLFSWVAIFSCGRAFHSHYPEGKWGTTCSLWTSTFPVRDIYTRIYFFNEFPWTLSLLVFVQDTKTFKTPTPPPPPSPTELPQSDIFTVNQLLNLYRQVCKWILFRFMTTSPVTTVSCFLFASQNFMFFFPFLQLAKTAPSGVISNRAFCDTIMDMTALTVRAQLL